MFAAKMLETLIKDLDQIDSDGEPYIGTASSNINVLSPHNRAVRALRELVRSGAIASLKDD